MRNRSTPDLRSNEPHVQLMDRGTLTDGAELRNAATSDASLRARMRSIVENVEIGSQSRRDSAGAWGVVPRPAGERP